MDQDPSALMRDHVPYNPNLHDRLGTLPTGGRLAENSQLAILVVASVVIERPDCVGVDVVAGD